MVIDTTISLGNIAQIVMLAGAILVFIFGLQRRIDGLSTRIEYMSDEMKKLNNVVSVQAVATTRLDRIEEDIREMRRGKGFILDHWRPPEQPAG